MSSLIAGKPNIPTFNAPTLGQSQTQAISQNTASLPALESLASGYNQFTTDEITKTLGQVIPGFANLTSNVSGKIDSYLKGEIPADVQSQIQENSAAAAETGGVSGSGFGGNITARDLGLTSLSLVDKGISSAQSWIGQMGQMFGGKMFNLSSMFVTPQQQFEDTFQSNTAEFQNEYAKDQNDYSHSLGVAGAQDLQDTGSTIMKLAGGFLGGGIGGMMGGAGGAPSGGQPSPNTDLDAGFGMGS